MLEWGEWGDWGDWGGREEKIGRDDRWGGGFFGKKKIGVKGVWKDFCSMEYGVLICFIGCTSFSSSNDLGDEKNKNGV